MLSGTNEAWFSLALCLVARLCCVREGANPDPVAEMFRPALPSLWVLFCQNGLTLQPAFNGHAHRAFLCYSDASSLKLVVI